MSRKTQKYVQACKTLKVPLNGDVPHEVLYGLLVARGYTWDGKHWTGGKPSQTVPAEVRIMAPPALCLETAQVIAGFLEASGAVIDSINGPFQNRKQNADQVRFYIKFHMEVY
jgi:hypothetical protein